MKKILAVLLAIMVLVLPTTACNQKENEDNSKETGGTQEMQTAPQKEPITAECVVKKGNRYVIVLPKSKASIPVDNAYVKYLPYVSDELVMAAEEKITKQVEELGKELNWTITEHEDKKMCLVIEVIQFVEGADYMDEVGCGIDHHHVFFAESIITE